MRHLPVPQLGSNQDVLSRVAPEQTEQGGRGGVWVTGSCEGNFRVKQQRLGTGVMLIDWHPVACPSRCRCELDRRGFLVVSFGGAENPMDVVLYLRWWGWTHRARPSTVDNNGAPSVSLCSVLKDLGLITVTLLHYITTYLNGVWPIFLNGSLCFFPRQN